MPPPIDWNAIRIHRGSQDQAFEELCSQLFRNEPPAGSLSFERRGYRDAGLECAYEKQDRELHGMQAKFFTRAPEDDEWKQVNRSIQTALAKNSTLTHLTFCIPQNFDHPLIEGQRSARDRWNDIKAKWEEEAQKEGRAFALDLWDETELVERLTRPVNRGKVSYFFGREEYSPEWFARRVEEVAADARPRYTEELRIQLPIAALFDGLGRTEAFEARVRREQITVDRASAHLHGAGADEDGSRTLIDKIGRDAARLVHALATMDLRSVDRLPLALAAS